MFALHRARAPLRLAARMPLLRPPRISAGYADQVPTMNNLLTNVLEKNPDSLPDYSSESDEPYTPEDFADPGAPYAYPDQVNPGAAPAQDYTYTKAKPSWRFHCHSTKTNTINTFTNPDGNVVAWFSGGSTGFKKRNRSSYEAGYQCAVQMFERIETEAATEEKENPDSKVTIDLFCKGFGQGRDALFKALMTAQGDGVRNRINSITDRTPLKIGGTRAKKRKRR
ncbi:hypothetical protein K438DRAFT_38834 [Mycena galopus ATCC 62051]|nr:hypothetical protein K438DRAFT_38834 [Mycena galopus ATCC 62051]